MKKLVTGSSGFIGSHYLEHYEDCIECDTKVNSHISSIRSEWKSLLDVDKVVHLAALTSATASILSPVSYWANNVTSLRKLLEVWEGPLDFASSAAVYQPLNPYALTKCVNENDLKGRADTNIFRFFNVFGERANGGVIKEFIQRALQDEPLIVYGENKSRSFVYVKDLVKQMNGESKDIGGVNISIHMLAVLIIEECNSNSIIIHQSERDGDPDTSRCASNYLFKDFEEGLTRTIEYEKRNKSNGEV